MTGYKNGEFCWTELMTTDLTAAKGFYGELYGYSYQEFPMGPDMPPYTMFAVGEKVAGGMATLQPEQLQQKVPPHWMTYVYCDDLAKTAGLVKQHGGQVLVEPFDIPDTGSMR